MRFDLTPALLKSLFNGKPLRAMTTSSSWQAGYFDVAVRGLDDITFTVFLSAAPNPNQFSPTPSTTQFYVSQAMLDAVELANGVFQADWKNLAEAPKQVRN